MTLNAKNDPAHSTSMAAQDEQEGPTSNMLTVKAMYDRVCYAEHHLGKLCSLFSQYNLKCASVRDRNDQVAKGIAKLAMEEINNSTTKFAMTMASEMIGCVGDQINAKVLRMESKLLPPLSSYGSICKHLKSDLKKAINAEQKLQSRKRDLDKLSEKVSDTRIQSVISLAETEFDKAEAESSRLNFLCQDNMLKFEHKRLQDLKKSLLMFFKIEIAYHSKALELVSDAFYCVSCIDEADDLKNLKASLGMKDTFKKTVSHSHNSARREGTTTKKSKKRFYKKAASMTKLEKKGLKTKLRTISSDGEVSEAKNPTPRKVKFYVENSETETSVTFQQDRSRTK